jgi:hypothetical protein
MKYLSALLLLFIFNVQAFCQNQLPEYFLNGKAVVLISNAPQARPVMDWKSIAEEIHESLVVAGGDPVAYYELENIILSEEAQAAYAEIFSRRIISNIVIITRQENGDIILHIAPFSGNKNIVPNGNAWMLKGNSATDIKESLELLSKNNSSKNLLVLEVPEFPDEEGNIATSKNFIAKNPLNLDMFKLGIPLSGAAGESGFISSFRYDMLGKSPESILAEQNAEKEGIEMVFNQHYPYQVEYLRTSKTEAELIADRVQFVLMRTEAREGDLMKNMGIPIENPEAKNDIVVKFYIKFLVRDELYIGPDWDADPNWRVALTNFLENLKTR